LPTTSAFGTQYYSGMLNTFGTFEQKYGYFEIRAELPPIAGTWPAFWMEVTPWKPNVEADIMEARWRYALLPLRQGYGGEGGNETAYDDAYNRDPSDFTPMGCCGQHRP